MNDRDAGLQQLLLDLRHLHGVVGAGEPVPLVEEDVRDAGSARASRLKARNPRPGQVGAGDAVVQPDVLVAVQAQGLHVGEVGDGWRPTPRRAAGPRRWPTPAAWAG